MEDLEYQSMKKREKIDWLIFISFFLFGLGSWILVHLFFLLNLFQLTKKKKKDKWDFFRNPSFHPNNA